MNIAALSRRTGVAPDTLRKWEQRYGVLKPCRTDGGQRRYSELDVARVGWLLARLAEGYRIGEAAALLGDGASPPPTGTDEVLDGLQAAVTARDHSAIARLFEQAFALHDIETTLVEVVQPLLCFVRAGSAAGELSIADAHLVKQEVRGRLLRLLTDTHGGVHGVGVLLCGPGDRHELGLLMFGVLLGRDGWEIAYLGPDTPWSDAVALAGRLSARLVAVSVGLEEHADALRRAFAEVELPPDFRVVVCGAAACPVLAGDLGAHFAGNDLPKAVRALHQLAS